MQSLRREGAAWPRIIDRVVMDRQADAFRERIRHHIDLEALGLELREHPTEPAFGLYAGEHRVGSIAATNAVVGRHKPLGNFMTDEAPWDRLQANLTEVVERDSAAADERVASTLVPVLGRHLYGELPESFGAELRVAGAAASERIRTQRARDYPTEAKLVDDDGRALVLRPLDVSTGVAVLPFTFERPGGPLIEASLRLMAGGEIIPLATDAEQLDDELVEAWVTALTGFADLTCPDEDERVGGQEDKQDLPVCLVPVGATREMLGAFVRGHIRHLPGGQRAQEGPRRLAEAIGITLRPGETWVKGHPRGAAKGRLTFAWHANQTIKISKLHDG